ncbi:hypothetical protein [Olleya sp. HaHaR_3_96]|uniref:hypothetical protein n=1 Tax=Olleya sp. HaHaR_3_96 TaxID=2745560 RepID=UPI001C4F634F|nr:hypothetical protein [Olleya sp. HaHaR_3_96]QXP58367.1 hypothetical protein H0I26_10575 [Olleya sp. HaHaR_3_96]
MKDGLKAIGAIIIVVVIIGVVGGVVTGVLDGLIRFLDSIPWWLWLIGVILFFYILSKQK